MAHCISVLRLHVRLPTAEMLIAVLLLVLLLALLLPALRELPPQGLSISMLCLRHDVTLGPDVPLLLLSRQQDNTLLCGGGSSGGCKPLLLRPICSSLLQSCCNLVRQVLLLQPVTMLNVFPLIIWHADNHITSDR
eukprot:GHUV01032664.1.p1 GENE.GHUV01032664.1~~GHUV01032664.1.p1  ORF type:complete len:136 (-),score=17.56 GHUV01032664.1:90-497(-)